MAEPEPGKSAEIILPDLIDRPLAPESVSRLLQDYDRSREGLSIDLSEAISSRLYHQAAESGDMEMMRKVIELQDQPISISEITEQSPIVSILSGEEQP